MNKSELYKIPNIFHIALEVATLHQQNNIERLNGIIWTLNRIYGYTSSTEDILNQLLVIRKETMFDDGWVNYNQSVPPKPIFPPNNLLSEGKIKMTTTPATANDILI